MKKRINVLLSMFFLGILLSGAISAQGIKVAGKITDAADGLPLAGVTILEKGSTNGTMTDVNGTYSINVPSGATLLVSYVGYLPQEIPVNNRTTIEIALALDVQAL